MARDDQASQDEGSPGRGTWVVGGLLSVSIVAGFGLAAVYAAGGDPQLEGAVLATLLCTLGAALVVWAHRLLPVDEVSEAHEPIAPPPETETAVALGVDPLGGRRAVLRRLLVGAIGALGLAAVFPIRSLGPTPGRGLTETPWRKGVRLVDASGGTIGIDDVPVASLATVYPEGHVGRADAVTVIVRVQERLLDLPPERAGWAPGGVVAYSKICTHAGCPVGLYQAESRTLLCPCHQSVFDVLAAARPTQGPAAEALPQLPLAVDDAGNLVADGDFSAPVGAAWWTRP